LRVAGVAAVLLPVIAFPRRIGELDQPGMKLAMAVSPAVGAVGEDLTFILSVEAEPGAVFDDVSVEFTLSDPAGLAAASSSTGSCPVGSRLGCDLGPLTAQGIATVTVVLPSVASGDVVAAADVTGASSGRMETARATATAVVAGRSCDVTGTSGADRLTVGDGAGSVVCGLGGDDMLEGAGGDDLFIGGDGYDTVTYARAPSRIVADLQTGSAIGWGADELVGVENLIGSGFADRLVGDEAPNRLEGGDGDDLLDGGRGSDALIGGLGQDTVVFASSIGGVNVDLAAGAASSQSEGSDFLTGIEDVIGSQSDDILSGDQSPNRLLGLGGDDLLMGLGSDDVLDGGPGIDTASFSRAPRGVTAALDAGVATGEGTDELLDIEDLVGSDFDDILTGSQGANALAGRGGTDLLRGEAGQDTLIGGDGSDTLIGGPGADQMDGGRGTDACAQDLGAGPEAGCEAAAYAEVGGIYLFEPSESVVGIGFHESLFDSALAARPLGRLTLNGSPAKFSPPPEAGGVDYVVMASRGRPTFATSAADIVVGSNSPVLSPVNGEVVEARRYLLYCLATDWQVVIRPDGGPGLLVMVLHMTNVPVIPGDRVIAAVTVIGTSWGNDAPTAEEDLYFPEPYPHVHIEVEAAEDAPIPGCPL
jgi:Ca2+-binding RTX toxin-like protein